MATKHPSCGTRLQMEISGTFTTIASVKSINGAGFTLTMLDTRTLEVCTPSKTPDAIENDDLTFEIIYDPDDTTHQALITAGQDRSLEDFKILWPDDSPCTFSAYVSGFAPTATVGSELTANVTLSIDGTITFPS